MSSNSRNSGRRSVSKKNVNTANIMDITFPYASQSSIVRSVQFDEYYQDYLVNETKNIFKQIFGKIKIFVNYLK